MFYHFQADGSMKAGFTGGTLLSVLTSIQLGDLAQSALFACVGATVSFFVSLGLRALTRRVGNKGRDGPEPNS